jgi:predicted metal-binding membrane protein
MRTSKRDSITITIFIVIASASAWIFLKANPKDAAPTQSVDVAYCGASAALMTTSSEVNPISSQVTGWGLMVIAMMLPKLIVPIQGIYARSFKRSRLSSSLLFISGYVTVWMAAGMLIHNSILALNSALPNSYFPTVGLSLVVVVWQFSPFKQRCLNKAHDHGIPAAFGWRAYSDSILLGIKHGILCVGSCWALMLLPMLLPDVHDFVMIIVTFIMLSEHLEHPRIPCWRFDLRAKLFRIILAQTQISLRRIYA